MIVLIDTNVILDYVLLREPFAETAMKCLEYIIINKEKAYLTASTITDIYYVSRRALQNNEAAKSIISKLLNAFRIAAVDKTDCLSALNTAVSDYEDALVSVCAQKVKAEWIITRNTKHFQNSSVPAITPEGFLEK